MNTRQRPGMGSPGVDQTDSDIESRPQDTPTARRVGPSTRHHGPYRSAVEQLAHGIWGNWHVSQHQAAAHLDDATISVAAVLVDDAIEIARLVDALLSANRQPASPSSCGGAP